MLSSAVQSWGDGVDGGGDGAAGGGERSAAQPRHRTFSFFTQAHCGHSCPPRPQQGVSPFTGSIGTPAAAAAWIDAWGLAELSYAQASLVAPAAPLDAQAPDVAPAAPLDAQAPDVGGFGVGELAAPLDAQAVDVE